MIEFIKKCIKIGGLAIRWVKRILLAPDHFGVPLHIRLWLSVCGGYMVDQYALYDFKHNDKKEFLSEFDWYKSRYINEPFDFILNNKLVCADILKQYIKVPETLFIKLHGRLSSYESSLCDYKEVTDEIRKRGQGYLKPINAGKGSGVYILKFENGEFYIDNDQVTEEKLISFLKKQNDWFISDVVHQCEYLNKIYDKTSNTIRFITMRDVKTEQFKVFYAVQRIGTKKTIPVDNGSRGGLIAKINLETGELSEARSLHSLEVHENHPDSGAPIKGVVIPGWDDLKKTMLDVANKFPYLNFIAWDILLTDDGPVIIEANTSSGVNIIQLWGGQRNGELGDFYRHYNVIK